MKPSRYACLVATLLFIAGSASAAPGDRSPDGLWEEIDSSELTTSVDREPTDLPGTFKAFEIDALAMRDLLRNAPLRFSRNAQREELVIALPMPDGGYRRFRVQETSVLAPDIATRYPEFKSYRVSGFDEPKEAGTLTRSPWGLSATIRTADGSVMIRPYSAFDASRHISYMDAGDSGQSGPCGVEETLSEVTESPGQFSPLDLPSEFPLRKMRLAIAATYEYATELRYPLDAAYTFAEIFRVANLLDEIYERDLGVNLELVSGSELVMTAPNIVVGTCSALNNSVHPCSLLSTAHCVLDHIMEQNEKDYDIGHLFGHYFDGPNGGGCASQGVCNDNLKGYGVTKIGHTENPVTPKSLRLVAHEIGHQFSADHTFSGTACPSGGDHLEPGSGSTIMGYRGRCPNQYVEETDANVLYFHVHSIEEISDANALLPSPLAGCGLQTGVTITSPVVDPLTDLEIPQQTRFTLTGTASDDSTEDLTYTWEQYNYPGGFSSDPFEDNAGPDAIFRSYFPGEKVERTFVQTNPPLPGEILPTLDTHDLPADQTRMRLVARDGEGGVGFAEMTIPVKGEPLRSYPYAGENTDGTMSILWEPGGSAELSPNVQILQLPQGQIGFIPLVSCTENDGEVRVPSVGCNNIGPRIKIRSLRPDCSDCGDPECQSPPGSYFFTDTEVPINVLCPCPVMRSCGPCLRSDCNTYDTGIEECWDQRGHTDCRGGESIHVTTCECNTPPGQLGGGNVIVMPSCSNDTSLGWACSSGRAGN